MAQPTPYVPTTDFSAEEANNAGGRAGVRTSGLDAEFDAIADSLGETLRNLALIQRDDGKLRDGIVELFNLSAVAKAALQARIVPRGAWAPDVAYSAYDLVDVDGQAYLCSTSHTSIVFADDYAADKWQAFNASDLTNIVFRQSGSGSVSRPMSDKASERITVEDYGAVGDGTTDDTNAFTYALTYAAAAGVGVVYTAPNRDYKTTALVTVPTGVSLQMGDGSAIVYSGSGTAVRVEPAAPDTGGETYASAQWYQRRNKISVRKATVAWHNAAGNTDTSSIGIQMVNQRYSRHELAVDGFWKNIELIGTDTGYAAGGAHVGNIYTIYSRNAKTHVGETRSGAGGYVNSNKWQGGLMRNDGGFVATGSRGFDGSPGANGWLFSGVNCEGTTIEQIFRFGGPKNTVLQCRFENATAGMIKILSTGGCSIVGGYLGAVGETLVDCDAGGIYTIQSEIGSWSQNAVASFAAYNARLSGTSGYFFRALSSAKLTLSEHEGGSGLNREDHYTSAGKYNATTNPSGLTNPAARMDWGSRAMRFRAASRDTDADAAAVSLNWVTAGFLALANAGFELTNNAYDKPLRLLNLRMWQDGDGYLRTQNGAPASDTTGLRVQTTQNESTAGRPTATAIVGQMYFDTTLGKPIWFKSPGWVDATGGAV